MRTLSTEPVNFGIIPIPDGMTGDGINGDGALRVSLVVAQSQDPKAGVGVMLDDLPAQIASLCGAHAASSEAKGLRVAFFDEQANELMDLANLQATLHHSIRLAAVAEDAAKAWRDLFPSAQIDVLHQVLTGKHKRPASRKPDPFLTRHYKAYEIAELFGQMRSGAIGATLRARLVGQEHKFAWQVKGAVPAEAHAKSYSSARAPFRFIFERTLQNALVSTFASSSDDEKGMAIVPPHGFFPISMGNACTLNEELQNRRVRSFIDKLDGKVQPQNTKAEAIDAFLAIPVQTRERLLDRLLLGVPLDPGIASRYLPVGSEGALEEHRIAQRLRFDLALKQTQFNMCFVAARGTPAAAVRAAKALKKYNVTADDELVDAVKAKYDALRAHPTLAKLLNLIVDIVVPHSTKLKPKGFLKVYFDTANKDAAPLVAYVLERDADERPIRFRPGAQREWPVPSATGKWLAPRATSELGLPLLQGMVKLDPERFKLSSTDVHSVVNATQVKLNELGSAQLAASDNRDNSARMVEERSRGIQLLDEEGHQFVLTNLMLRAAPTDAIYAESLVTGYRVLTRRTPRRGPGRAWRSLTARSVRYDPVAPEYSARPNEAIPAWKPYEHDREREHGAVRPLPRQETKDDGKDRAVGPSHIFTWFGDSLGVPAPQYADDAEPLDSDQSAAETLRIGFGLEYDYPRGSEYLLPALRIGDGYEFALSPVYLHGGGPTLAEAQVLLQNPELIAGRPLKDAPLFLFGRPTDIQAPVVLLSPQDRLVTRKPMPRNEQVERIVLRSGAGEDTDRAVRFLAPPRVEYSTAEQYGVIDADDNAIPLGAMTLFEQDPDTGDFASIERPGPDGKSDKLYVLRPKPHFGKLSCGYFPDPAARNLGLAFERDDAPAAGFPDLLPPLAFWPGEKPGDQRASLEALPVKLEFRRWPTARKGGRVVRSGERSELDNTGIDLPSMTIELAPAEEVSLWTWCWPDLPALFRARPQLRWTLARNFMLSETALAKRWDDSLSGRLASEKRAVHLALDTSASMAGMQRSQFYGARELDREFLALAGEPGANKVSMAGAPPVLVDEVMAAITQALFRQLPLNGVTGWYKIDLVHAVAKPRNVPVIAYTENQVLMLQPVRLLPGVSMAAFLEANGGKLPKVPHQYGGSRLFFAGEIGFDRASTRSLRVEASWPLLDHELAIVDIADGTQADVHHFVDRPPRIDRVLFDIRDIPRDGGLNGEFILDLLRDEVGRLRELSSQSDSNGAAGTAARIIDLRIVATSRFSDYFEPEPAGRRASDLGKFEVETRRFQGGGAPPAPTPGEVHYVVAVPATLRPSPPVVTHIEWIAPERRERLGDDHLRITKQYAPRLYLYTDTRMSGEHELVAVAFLPAGAIVDHEYSPATAVPDLTTSPFAPVTRLQDGFSDEFARFVANPVAPGMFPKDFCKPPETSPSCAKPDEAQLDNVTRWGGDPTTAPMGRLEAVISPTRFSGHVGAVSRVQMPLPGIKPEPTGAQASLVVGVLLFRPQLDAQTGNWYIDIGIDPGAAHAPFVRLALARYQPYALQETGYDLRLSTPLLLDPFRVPAPRTVEVLHPHGKPIVASVYGVGYRRRMPFGVSDAVRHLTDMPLQNIELMRTGDGTPAALLQAYNHDGEAMRCELIQPTPSGPVLHWRGEFNPPATARPQRYALVIDEVDMHIPDAVLDENTGTNPRGALDVQANQLFARQSFFSLTVALDD